MNQEKIKTAISPYTYVGIMYEKIKKQDNFIKKSKDVKREISRFTVGEILTIVANNWGVTEDDIIRHTIKQTHVDARFTFFASLKLKYQMDLDTIGEITNKRHHTSVIHGLRAFYNRYHNIENFRRISDDIFTALGMEYVGNKLTNSLEPYENKRKNRP